MRKLVRTENTANLSYFLNTKNKTQKARNEETQKLRNEDTQKFRNEESQEKKDGGRFLMCKHQK